MGNITIQGDITATVPGNAVGGASALTTTGSVPFVTAAGVLGQSANLFWDNANARLGVGTATPSSSIESRGTSNRVITAWTTAAGADAMFENRGASSRWYSGITASHDAKWSLLNVNSSFYAIQVHGATNNVTIGTTTDDGTNRLQVAGGIVGTGRIRSTGGNMEVFTGFGIQNVNANGMSIAFPSSLITMSSSAGQSLMSLSDAGALELRNATPTTGSTSLVVRAGAGQTGNLTTWQSAAAGVIAYINSQGGFAANEFYNTNDRFYQNSAFVDVGSALLYRFSSTVLQGGTKDLSLSRASANVLQVGDGGSNSNGTILARRVQSAGETVANLPAAAAGNAGTITYITDANATTIGSTVAGGGINKVLVWSNGTAWKIFAS